MGITEQGLEFLLSAKQQGVSFDATIMIGRQSLQVAQDRLDGMLLRAGVDGREGGAKQVDGFAERLFEHLGATEVCSIDGSDYEGATHIHNFNDPLPSDLAERFTAVVDGGSLEHIFDFPTAIRNTMQMVNIGGRLLCMTPANNVAGHGFYQFSPELYFRVLNPANGFHMERMLLAEMRPWPVWWEVLDPAQVGRRGSFTTRYPTILYVQAQKTGAVPFVVLSPTQSDYQEQWRQPSFSPAGSRTSVVDTLKAAARRQPAIRASVRAIRKTAVGYRLRRPALPPSHFKTVGRRLI